MGRTVYITSDMSSDENLIRVAEQDTKAALIWPWILASLDDWGRGEAKPREIKAKVFRVTSLSLIAISIEHWNYTVRLVC